jgi:23S rRNA (cytosine1962-C5)-methyltransferase
MLEVEKIVEAALDRRRELMARTDLDAYRVFHGAPDGITGLVVDRFGPVLIVQLHEDRMRITEDQARAVVSAFHERLGTRAVYRKLFVRDRAAGGADIAAAHNDPQPWMGEPVEPELTIAENGLRFIIRPYDGYAPGLFLEQRDNRQRVRDLAVGRRVLNTFSYTCGFSVAAVAGGAASVASVDLHKRYLEWGKANFTANGFDPAGQWFFCSDVFEFYRRAERQGRRFDLIILDPPTFSRLRRPARTFNLAEQIDELCRGAVGLLDTGGIVLLAANDRGLSLMQMEEALAEAGGARTCEILEHPWPPIDFPNDPDFSKAVFAKFS